MLLNLLLSVWSFISYFFLLLVLITLIGAWKNILSRRASLKRITNICQWTSNIRYHHHDQQSPSASGDSNIIIIIIITSSSSWADYNMMVSIISEEEVKTYMYHSEKMNKKKITTIQLQHLP